MSDWQADTYDGLPLPHEQWGERLLSGLRLHGHETVLDAGCGTGRDTAAVLERLPRGRVVALDASPAMLGRLRVRLPVERRVLPVRADLSRRLPLRDASVDVVISVAALHWLPDHTTVWSELGRVVRPGGRLCVECGGAGNIAKVSAAVRELRGELVEQPWTFAGVAETLGHLEAAGFVGTEVRLRPDPARLPDRDTFLAYLSTVVLRDLDDVTVAGVAALLDEPVVDYVRLEVTATRG